MTISEFLSSDFSRGSCLYLVIYLMYTLYHTRKPPSRKEKNHQSNLSTACLSKLMMMTH